MGVAGEEDVAPGEVGGEVGGGLDAASGVAVEGAVLAEDVAGGGGGGDGAGCDGEGGLDDDGEVEAAAEAPGDGGAGDGAVGVEGERGGDHASAQSEPSGAEVA
jgi:hypothetical protein